MQSVNAIPKLSTYRFSQSVRDSQGDLADPDGYDATPTEPWVEVIESNGNIVASGLAERQSEGVYIFDFTPNIESHCGYTECRWTWTMDGLAFTVYDYVIVETFGESFYKKFVFTPDELRSFWMFGLRFTDKFCNDFGDRRLWQLIYAALKIVEDHLEIRIRPWAIWSHASVLDFGHFHDRDGNLLEVDEIEPAYDYSSKDMWNWGYLQLRKIPVLKISDMKMVYPTGITIMEIPEEWIRIYPFSGELQLVPTAGALNRFIIGPAGQYIPALLGVMTDKVPYLHQLKYYAGFLNIPDDIRQAIGMVAAMQAMTILGNALIGGIASQSISADGLSESYSTTASAQGGPYQGTIESFRKELFDPKYGLMFRLKDKYSGIDIVVV